jgi:hypothetical protein
MPKNWHEQLTALFTGLFLLQFVIWISKEDGIWLDETVTVVQLTLLVAVIAGFFPMLHWSIRRILELAGILIVLAIRLDYKPVGRKIDSFSDFIAMLGDNFVQLTPFFWFAVGAWIVFLFAYWWMKAKWRIFVILISSVAFFAIRDSYSFLVLWRQVALLILSGLFLLIIQHFSELKKKNPVGWSKLAEYPFSVAVPVTFLVSLVVFIGTLAPDVRAVLTDPYTLWKSMRGEQVEVFNKGFGTSAFLALNSTSGYSRNDSRLGGEFQFDHTPVMTVVTSHRSYWRGETRSLYTGRGWIQSEEERRAQLVAVSSETALPEDPALPPSQLKTIEVTQTFTILEEDEQFPVLFGAYPIDQVISVNNSGSRNALTGLLWSPRHSEIRVRERSYPQTYTVISQVPVIDEAELRKAPATVPQGLGLEPYLFLPETLPERVKTLARQVTASGTTMYDKAKLLEQYLSTNYTYTNTPDLSKGKSRDFVDRFLFEIEEGYCDYFSTAMAVMARSLGMPTRWVKGYAPGVSEFENEFLGMDMLDPADLSGEYTVRNSDAHSWVEIYFHGYGWIPFEPTAGFSLPVYTVQEEVAVSPLPELAEDPADALAQSAIPRAVGWGAGAVLLAAAAGFAWVRRDRIAMLQYYMKPRKARNENERVVLEFEKLLRFAKRKGYTRKEHETVREMAQRWISKDRWLEKDLEALLQLFEKAKYSGSEITQDELSFVSRTVHKLREEL